MILSSILAALALLSPGDPADGVPQAESVLVRHPLKGAQVPYDAGSIEGRLLISAGAHLEQDPLREIEPDVPDAAWVADLVVALFGEELQYEGRDVELQSDGSLLVLAPPDVQEKVRAAVRSIEETLAAPVELRIDVLDLGAGAEAPFGGRTVVDLAEVEGLRAAAGTVQSFAVTLQAGRTAVVDQRRRIPVLVDYDVEIAQGTAVHDPIVGEAEAGTRICVRAAPAAGGLVLSMIVTDGRALTPDAVAVAHEMRSFVSSEAGGEGFFVDGPSMLESVEIAFQSFALDTFLPDGKALVVHSALALDARAEGGAESRRAVVVRKVAGGFPAFRRLGLPGGRELCFVNAEAVGAPRIESWESPSAHQDKALERLPGLTVRLDVGQDVYLADWMSARFSDWRTLGPWLVGVFDPGTDRDAADRLQALVAGWRPDVDLLELDLAARRGGTEAARLRLPVRPGSSPAMIAGVVTTSLVDYDVEVAQFAGTADPTVRTVFTGMAARAEVGSLAAVEVDAAVQLRRAPADSIGTGGPLIGALQQNPLDVLRVAQRLVPAPGAAGAAGGAGVRAVLGDSGGGDALSLEIAVR